ncbi:MAG TPA: MBL fold metallo-hydrolase, partial [Albitalea sp.]|nr:MBL fold metallo-hydrolase [Albitalea sp.]
QPVDDTATLELVVLGSGGPGATGRAGSSYAVLLDGKPRILVDAGPGSFVRAGEARLGLRHLDIVLLTHLHADHAGELPGLVKARSVASGGSVEFRIFGPSGHGRYPSTRRFIELLFGKQGAFGYLSDFSAKLKMQTSDVDARRPGAPVHTLVKEDGLVIRAVAGHHRDAPALIYRIDYKGHSLVFSGDIDAAGLPGLQALAQDAELLVFNSVVLDPPGSPPQLYELHTPPKRIGEVAAAAKVAQLLLTHLSPLVERSREAVQTSIHQSYGGPVVFAEDGLRFKF